MLYSSVQLEDHNLSIQGYSLIRADHPDNVKKGGIFSRKFNSESD